MFKIFGKCKPWKFLRKMYKMNRLRVYTRNNVFIPEYLVSFKTVKTGNKKRSANKNERF